MKSSKSALSIVKKYHPDVKRVVDAKEPLTIIVTAADCRNAKIGAPDACAMSKALNHIHDGAIVSLSVAYVIDGDKATRYKVPNSVSREIVSFDRNKKFAPGEYWLSAPSEMEKLGARNRPQNVKVRKPEYTGIKKRYHRTTGIRSIYQG